MITHPARITLAALLAALAAPALATIYKYERPDGSLVYSDAPVKDARLIERFPVEPSPSISMQQQPARSGREQQRAQPPARNPAAELDAADAQVRAAQQAVDEARARLEQGAEPQPGERVGVGGGRSRLTDDYFSRQAQLRQQLGLANARLEEAYRRRSQAK